MAAKDLFFVLDLVLLDVLGVLLLVGIVAKLNNAQSASRLGRWKTPLSVLIAASVILLSLRTSDLVPTVNPDWTPQNGVDWFVAGSDWLLHDVVAPGLIVLIGLLGVFLFIAVKNRVVHFGQEISTESVPEQENLAADLAISSK